MMIMIQTHYLLIQMVIQLIGGGTSNVHLYLTGDNSRCKWLLRISDRYRSDGNNDADLDDDNDGISDEKKGL